MKKHITPQAAWAFILGFIVSTVVFTFVPGAQYYRGHSDGFERCAFIKTEDKLTWKQLIKMYPELEGVRIVEDDK